jgi:PST family polysaccharide transporter
MTAGQGDNLGRRTLAGLGWNVAGTGANRVLSFVVGVVLANLLLPDDFGLIMMARVFVGLAVAGAMLGLVSGLMLPAEVDDEACQSVFWLTLTLGAAMSVLVWLGAPLLALLYGEPRLTAVTRGMAVLCVIESLYQVPLLRLKRQLRFRALALCRVTSTLLAGVLAVILALRGWSAQALVMQMVIALVYESALMWLLARWWPRWGYSWAKIKGLLGFSLADCSSTLLHHLAGNLDYFFIGRLAGAGAAGIYTRANTLVQVLQQVGSQAVAEVTWPVMASLGTDPARCRRYFVGFFGLAMVLVGPPLALLACLAEPLVWGLFGRNWVATIPVLRLLCAAGIVQAMILQFRTVLQAKGYGRQLVVVTVLRLVANVAAVVIGLHWGLVGVATALIVAQVLLAAPLGWAACRMVDSSWPELLRPLWRLAVATTLACLAVRLLARLLPTAWPMPTAFTWEKLATRWPHLMELLVLGGAGAAVLALACWLLREPLCREAWQRLRHRGRPADAA